MTTKTRKKAPAKKTKKAASKPMGLGPNTRCPVCHRYKTTRSGRMVAHEYPSGGMCAGEGRVPL